jgi:hypothetical protein
MGQSMRENRGRRDLGLRAWLSLVCVASAAPHAKAQEVVLTGPLAGAPAVRESGAGQSSRRDSRVVMPTGHLEVAGETAFLMSKSSPYADRLALTDLALFRLSVRRSFADWFELYAGGAVLPKQPTSTHASLFQGAHFGAQAEMVKGIAASLGFAAGPLFGADGVYYRTGPGLTWKPSVSEYLRFVVGLGNGWTILDYRQKTSSAFWLGEVLTHAETQFGDRNASMWVGMDYAVPFASRPHAAAADETRGYLNPQVRLNLEVGGVLSLHTDGWDVYATYTIVDRGELDKPETTLPILDGGFDQQQVVIGVEYRFEPKRRHEERAW